MTIDWNAFTPWASLAGGVLIGVAAAMFVLLNGRVAGISGVLAGLLEPMKGDVSWRLAFVLGLVAAPAVYALLAAPPTLNIDAGWGALVLAGLLVGVGTRYGSGCTSGHGRLRPFPALATLPRGNRGFHGGRFRNRVRRPPRCRHLRSPSCTLPHRYSLASSSGWV